MTTYSYWADAPYPRGSSLYRRDEETGSVDAFSYKLLDWKPVSNTGILAVDIATGNMGEVSEDEAQLIAESIRTQSAATA